MHLTVRWLSVLVACAALVIGIAACGSSSGESSSSSGSETTSESASGEEGTSTTAGAESKGEEVSEEELEGNPPPGSVKSGPISLGAYTLDASIPIFTPLIKAQEETAAKLGAEIDVRNGEGELTKEIAIVQQFIAEHKDAIVVSPSDPKGIAPVINLANEAGIPVVAAGITVEGAPVVTYVGANDEEYGEKLAEGMCKLLHGKGKIAIILGILGSSPEFERLKGIETYISSECPGLEIIDKQSGENENAKALAVGQNLLNKYPKGQLDGVIDEGPEGVAPAQYAHQNGRSEVKWVVGDVPKEVAAAIEAGTINMAVYQNPTELGALSVEDVVKWVRGEAASVPRPRDNLKLTLVDKSNLSSIEPY
ncbi:MAG: sugar ABC transporter substrate-binding protein [Actinobacteria bacterium]|nr:sugar ABC transporter substrate-binding protein [Actinomycetota bacterium]